MERLTKNALRILACSLLLCLCSCSLTLGPVVERKAIIVLPGVPIEVLENVKVEAHVLTEEEVQPFKQDIGGWITMHPDHWASLKKEMERLKDIAGEE